MSHLVHCFKMRVYYEDTDHGRRVYYANYLKFMERARTEYLRDCGLELDVLDATEHVQFAVTGVDIRYLQGAGFNDLLEVESTLSMAQGARLAFRQVIYLLDRKTAERTSQLTSADVQLACLNSGNHRPCRIPESVMPVLKIHQSD
ncbi:MAG: YbgC/FadM family acyl-CoA thioesterase [Mariprofundaceae bacterium]|nr:YbgC/FadM family acyl-CoA thioesterase [Mariprofundaceae bacterium]